MPLPLLALAALKAAPAVIEGGTKLYQNYKGGQKAKADQTLAKQSFDQSKANYFSQDISNPYANTENAFEDLTVNTQQSDFLAEQQQQGLANTMTGFNAAAGGSGIAALAQSLAGQQSKNLQQSSADIGRQESSNQLKTATEASRNQYLKAEGDIYSRGIKSDLMGTQLGMDMADVTSSTEALQGFQEGMGAAAGQLAGGVADGISAYSAGKAGNASKVTKSDLDPLGLGKFK